MFVKMSNNSVKLKTYKLNVHKKDFFKEDLVINQKEFPHLKIGDVIEIYSPDDQFSRLLMQVNPKAFDDYPRDGKENQKISIEQTIALTFQLRNYCDVVINKVDKNSVVLDSVELFFKDQYIARSDMWRLKRSVSDTCVYLNQKIEFCNIRCQVFEMWSQGERVASGYVNHQTKVVYRSASSMVYLFLQMSSEMWDFDINGDLYFEKAVNGFLSDLFDKWKRFNCSHDVTIVLFSRTYYDAYSIEDFPEQMREGLQQDFRGKYYEDYYRVAVQNERYDDWSPTLISLRRLFNQYENEVIKYHEKQGLKVPRAYNSSSSQGNFLEVLNMSLNVFERHHLDRSFDRTGQLSVVISPGVGVYEVDLDLTNITKQRIIDNGIGSDLVCLGEQPLHAVPLFKFNAKFNLPTCANMSDVQYNMPHWINLSFYSSSTSKPIMNSNFVPRIKLPNVLPKTSNTQLYRSPSRESPSPLKSCRNIPFVDYDEYDSQIFKVASSPPSAVTNKSCNTCQPSGRRNTVLSTQGPRPQRPMRRSSDVLLADEQTLDVNSPLNSPSKSDSMEIPSIPRRYRSHLSPLQGYFSHLSTSVENKSIKDFKAKPESKDDLMVRGYSSNTSGRDHLKSKALINPFDPSHVTIKLNSNRRRWTHVFPLGRTGIFMQQHHYQAVPQNTACTLLPSAACADASLTISDSRDPNDSQNCRKISIIQMKSSEHPWNTTEKKMTLKNITIASNLSESLKTGKQSQNRSASIGFGVNTDVSKNVSSVHSDKSLLWAWGATGEQEWTPAITTGVDWKSLVMPACLPITTDFLPDKRTLQQDYVTYGYNLLPEDQSADLLNQRCYRGEEDSKYHQPLSTIQVYLELICQRLQQGFQIILLPNNSTKSSMNGKSIERYEYAMSIGRIFHELKLDEKTIYVTNYHPRHPYPVIKIHYCYRIRTPDNTLTAVSWTDFTSEKLETYKWNYLDNYTCIRADGEYELRESLKYWRFRLLMLPSMQSITKTIIDKYLSGEDDYPCDLYHDFTAEEKIQLQEGFIKFLETINRIRRPANTRKTIAKPERKTLSALTINRRFSSSAVQSPVPSLQSPQTPVNRMSQPLDINPTENYLKDNLNTTQKLLNPLKLSLNLTDKAMDCDEVDGGVVSTFACKSPIIETELHQNEDSVENNETNKRLTAHSSHLEIIEAMKKGALNFLTKTGLLPFTFISAEAVFWAKNTIDSITTEGMAISLFQSMIESDLICHASGDKSQPFKHGFYLYCILDNTIDVQTFKQDSDIQMFEKEWMEAVIVPQSSQAKNYEQWYTTTNEIFSNGLSSEVQDFTLKNTILDLDDGSKNGRVEWVNLKYHSVYDPEQAFEVIIEWMVATGNSISEIVMGWSRKTTSTGLHLVPIPADPFALPFSSKSDPLRGPIYITINIDSLPKIATKLLEGEGLFNFQERILVKFGFIPFHDPTTDNQRQFVHVSGSIFVMIPSKNPASSPYKSARKRGKFVKVDDNDTACSPHEEYITRHFSGVKQAGESARIDAKIGFLWCWNYMITKRWKTGVTGDENSMRKIMEDFRAFCENKNQRLSQFWENYYLKGIQQNVNEFNI